MLLPELHAGGVPWLQVSKCRGALWGRGDKVSHEGTNVQGVQNVCVGMHQRKVCESFLGHGAAYPCLQKTQGGESAFGLGHGDG